MKRAQALALLIVLLRMGATYEDQLHAQATNTESKKIKSMDLSAMDTSADPCSDFYQYSCGNWMKNNPIPPDQARWGRFSELVEHNRQVLRQILESASTKKNGRTPQEKMVGDYYSACMNESAAEIKGSTPLKSEFNLINAIDSRADLFSEIGRLHRLGGNELMSFFSSSDFADASNVIAWVDQGGLSLPDRDYYIKDDDKSKETRERFLTHVQKMFELTGDDSAKAAAEAKAVMKIETALAQASMDRTLRRDPKTRDHKMSYAELKSLVPNFDFDRYLAATQAPKFTQLNVGNPEFYKQIDKQIDSWPMADLKTYLKWQFLDQSANALSSAFVNEAFEFNNKFLAGAKELQPRWKRCVQSTDAHLGEPLGQLYINAAFGGDAKDRTLDMVQRVERSMAEDVRGLDWMSDTTKAKAMEKLNAIINNMGYPDKWRDYSKVKISSDDFFGNGLRSTEFEYRRQIQKIGTNVDRKEWAYTAPTVNAYASPPRATINFMAGILQPPFFDQARDEAVNYGAIGVVIGHELTHLFDDQGRKFDKDGNLRDWWTEADGKAFDERASCIADEYSGFTAIADVKLNGRLTLGENTADNGGMKIAYMAFEEALQEVDRKEIDGFTPEQRFFLGFGQIWCENSSDQTKRLFAKTDPHSPGRYRVNGTVPNSPEFQKAFGCKAGQPMVRENRCRVW